MEKILLDCDPGHDDALAIMLAAGDPRAELLGITTVAGNQTIEKVTHNARAVCTVAGIEVPVAQGAAGPLAREAPIIAPDYHGESGLDGPQLPEPAVPLDPRTAAAFIIETVLAHEPGTVTLVPTGPLTNIALALALEPRLADRVKRVCLMGGSYTRG
ncbi:MAG TPA: nucleoside hydrolase, partial [Actinomycetaceae bacterium]|nr:nucleoside hydrolase [Actinomycetaceae bacterium]